VADFIHVPEIPERFRESVRALLGGRAVAAPAGITREEVDALVDAVRVHAVAPLLYRSLPSSEWPPEIVDTWRHDAISAAALESLRLVDLHAVLDSLRHAAVPVLILKGTALAYSLYDEPHERLRADTDLLIRTSDRETVDRLLVGQGFTRLETSGDELAVRQMSYLRRDAFGKDHVYDVHWAITNTPVFAELLSFDQLFERSTALVRLGSFARGLSSIDALLYACIHRVAHHHGSDRLIWLVDIQRLRARLSPEERKTFWDRASNAGLIAVCRDTFDACARMLGDRPDDAAEFLSAEELSRRERTAGYLHRDARRGEILMAELRALSWQQRVIRLRQLMFPPRAYMRQQFGARALPIAYGTRALRGVARLFRRIGLRPKA
jgi:hypothetical protein